MQALTLWISVIAIVLIIAYLVAPGSQAGDVIKAFGNASAQNIRALAGGAYLVGKPSTTQMYQV